MGVYEKEDYEKNFVFFGGEIKEYCLIIVLSHEILIAKQLEQLILHLKVAKVTILSVILMISFMAIVFNKGENTNK